MAVSLQHTRAARRISGDDDVIGAHWADASPVWHRVAFQLAVAACIAVFVASELSFVVVFPVSLLLGYGVMVATDARRVVATTPQRVLVFGCRRWWPFTVASRLLEEVPLGDVELVRGGVFMDRWRLGTTSVIMQRRDRPQMRLVCVGAVT